MTLTVCIDTNILISYLLGPDAPSPPSTIMRRALSRDFRLVISEHTLTELREKAIRKQYLVKRVSATDVLRLENGVRRIATIVPAGASPRTHTTRDPKDDYLLAPEIITQVDHIVTGDKDLLEYTGIELGFILTAAAFLRRLDDESTGITS